MAVRRSYKEGLTEEEKMVPYDHCDVRKPS